MYYNTRMACRWLAVSCCYAAVLAKPSLCCAQSVLPDSALRNVMLDDIFVYGQSSVEYQKDFSQTGTQIGQSFITDNLSSSLMQTLQAVPGVKASAIGSSQSKPIVRGLGLNRVVVTVDGVKHDGQQWADDHGLDIDQFSVDRAEVLKGPSALIAGSDAVGGLLRLYTNSVPVDTLEGKVSVFYRSNSDAVGLSGRVGGRYGRFFYKGGLTAVSYADYRVPADSITYNSYNIRLKNGRLRNTAGNEASAHLRLGYISRRLRSDVKISDSYSRSGFFANAHGLEVRLSSIDYDSHSRDIDLPCQMANHLTLLSHTDYRFASSGSSLSFDAAWQNDFRRESSEAVSHGYMPKPQGTTEREFRKNNASLNAMFRVRLPHANELQAGVSGEFQHNRIGGWGFIIPDFEVVSAAVFASDRMDVTPHLSLNAGLRYDLSRVSIHSYHDWYKSPVGSGSPDSLYVERSKAMDGMFSALTWSAGVVYDNAGWILKANVGKGFRVPTAKELGCNGISYQLFRYEQGNPSLSPEESYQLDASVIFQNKRLTVEIDPYINYFPNYIYLNPTPDYIEGMQLYNYTQARVWRWGAEAQVTYSFCRFMEASVKGEYLYARQLSGSKKGYTLPFSTPWSADMELRYKFGKRADGFVAMNVRIVGDQDEIVPPELPTDGYWTLNASAGKAFRIKHYLLSANVRAENLLHCRYYDHPSYYRLLGVPEPGINVQAMLTFEF